MRQTTTLFATAIAPAIAAGAPAHADCIAGFDGAGIPTLTCTGTSGANANSATDTLA